jgi:hypothetical protein
MIPVGGRFGSWIFSCSDLGEFSADDRSGGKGSVVPQPLTFFYIGRDLLPGVPVQMNVSEWPDRLHQSTRGIGEVADLADQVFIMLEGELIHIGRNRKPTLHQFGDPFQVIETALIDQSSAMTTFNRIMSLKNNTSFH